MQVKVTWSEKDIKYGRVVGKVSVIERWMIGYIVISKLCFPHSFSSPNNTYCLNRLSDGVVIPFASKELLVQILNEGEYLPIEIMGRPS